MNSKILDKIKKLLRLATSSNQHEAALALSRAQKLMQEHGIESDDPALAGVKDATISALFRARVPTQYLLILAYSIAKAFGCEFYFKPTFKNMQIVYIGHNERPEVAGYVFNVLERQLTKARKEFLDTLSTRMKRANKTKRADQFCEGWCMGVHNKIEQFALTEKERTELIAFKDNVDMVKGEAREAKGSGRIADDAKYQGYKSAKNVTLNHGVNGQAQQRIAS
ncbi:DUF2786 domain-containing protein [Shewanella baltica]|uniref:DUF2786 domain-containing protein n=1 Tax=Shewanella baltica TaxID=62322 RepID=UPI002167BDD8|nr:DUF2786 domain-containing protein [Shewanella baltica]MCS6113049.1 DUF2786 domain-containing protein [Shewanella baltica]UVW64243.1 DUF2786 domain-containing protein [Shewanella baltica]